MKCCPPIIFYHAPEEDGLGLSPAVVHLHHCSVITNDETNPSTADA